MSWHVVPRVGVAQKGVGPTVKTKKTTTLYKQGDVQAAKRAVLAMMPVHGEKIRTI